MATHSSIPAWRTPWIQEPGELQFIRSQRVRHDFSDLAGRQASGLGLLAGRAETYPSPEPAYRGQSRQGKQHPMSPMYSRGP